MVVLTYKSRDRNTKGDDVVNTGNDWMSDKYKDALENMTTLKPFHPDSQGDTDKFLCVKCENLIVLPYKKDICPYLYCPYCGKEIV